MPFGLKITLVKCGHFAARFQQHFLRLLRRHSSETKKYVQILIETPSSQCFGTTEPGSKALLIFYLTLAFLPNTFNAHFIKQAITLNQMQHQRYADLFCKIRAFQKLGGNLLTFCFPVSRDDFSKVHTNISQEYFSFILVGQKYRVKCQCLSKL